MAALRVLKPIAIEEKIARDPADWAKSAEALETLPVTPPKRAR